MTADGQAGSAPGQGRRAYLLETAARLWPGDGRVHAGRTSQAPATSAAAGPVAAGGTGAAAGAASGRGADGGHGGARGAARRPSHLLVPSADAARLMLPAGSGRAAAAAVLGYGGHGSVRAWLKIRVLAGLLASGAGRFALPDRLWIGDGEEGLDAHLSEVLGQEVLIALHIGPPRANRKPVLQLLTPAGHTVAFAKLGVNELTRRLVDAEAQALRTVAAAAPAGIEVPRVLHHARWHDLAVLVQSALPVRRSRPTPAAQRLAAMTAIARSGGTAAEAADYVGGLRERLAALPSREAAAELSATVDRVAAAGRPLVFGAWHGDWTPWNTAYRPDQRTVLIWDWERYAVGVPLGFDALHHSLQTALGGAARPTVAHAAAVLTDAPELLAPFAVEPSVARDTAALYLVEIASRYLADDQAAAGGQVGRVDAWLLPALRAAPAASTA